MGILTWIGAAFMGATVVLMFLSEAGLVPKGHQTAMLGLGLGVAGVVLFLGGPWL